MLYIAFRSSGGRGEYELAGSDGSTRAIDALGKQVELELGDLNCLRTGLEVTLQGGKLRLRRTVRSSVQVHRQLAAALLLPDPTRSESGLSDPGKGTVQGAYLFDRIETDGHESTGRVIRLHPTRILVRSALATSGGQSTDWIGVRSRARNVHKAHQRRDELPTPLREALGTHEEELSRLEPLGAGTLATVKRLSRGVRELHPEGAHPLGVDPLPFLLAHLPGSREMTPDIGVKSIPNDSPSPREDETTKLNSSRVWLISVISGSGDYDDDVATCYQYDNNVAYSRQISVGDIVFVRKDDLIVGTARVEEIDEWAGEKELLRCPHCGEGGYHPLAGGAHRCYQCDGPDFREPAVSVVPVTKFRAQYGSTWRELTGETSVKEFRDRLGWPSSSGKGRGSIQEVPDESREVAGELLREAGIVDLAELLEDADRSSPVPADGGTALGPSGPPEEEEEGGGTADVSGAAGGTAAMVTEIQGLVVFKASQALAYRERFERVRPFLGPDIPTRLSTWLMEWVQGSEPGLVVLTGNAGTGKTAASEAFAKGHSGTMPDDDQLTSVGSGWLSKDLSGIAGRDGKSSLIRTALGYAEDSQVLLCANEGPFRQVTEDLSLDFPDLKEAFERALRNGASQQGMVTVVNVNRQRFTGDQNGVWERLLDFISREEIWTACGGCPGCPMRENAAALRDPGSREVLRLLIQGVSGSHVVVIRELLALLVYMICYDAEPDSGAGRDGGWTCETVKREDKSRGQSAFHNSAGFFNLVFGNGLDAETIRRSPLLRGLRDLGGGAVADLEVDGWLRDTDLAPERIRELVAATEVSDGQPLPVGHSKSHLDRVKASENVMTFSAFGEAISLDVNLEMVNACQTALTHGTSPVLKSWRRRVLFQAAEPLGGAASCVRRLTSFTELPRLVELSRSTAAGRNDAEETRHLVRGLNFLVVGDTDAANGLIVPEPGSLFARKPGSFRHAEPSLVHCTVETRKFRLEVPDTGLVEEILDIDHIEVALELSDDPTVRLVIGPKLFQMIHEGERFKGPVDHGDTEMARLKTFYGRLTEVFDVSDGPLRIADPVAGGLVPIGLPVFDNQ